MNTPNWTDYLDECRKRWHGDCLWDARQNWHDWKLMHDQLETALREYHRNPQQEGVGGDCHNPDGTLTSFLWKLQTSWQPDKSCLRPFLDFCDHYQTIFLRRGLVIYCSLVLRTIEAPEPQDENQLTLV